MNSIESIDEKALENLPNLKKLNLSNALNTDKYLMTRLLCELNNLEVLDLSFLNLEKFTLKCWESAKINLIQLHLRHTRNAQGSWLNWFPFIGNRLELLDLTDAKLMAIDLSLPRNMIYLSQLSLADNKLSDKESLVALLKTDNFIDRLKVLNLSNVSATDSNFKLDSIIHHSDNISLTHLDVSYNNFSNTDLNTFLFNQPKFKQLKVFRAVSCSFRLCNQTLIADSTADTSLLESLEELHLSRNELKGANCLYSIKSLAKLKQLDLSHNEISATFVDLMSNGLVKIFAEMLNLTHIDLSFNKFGELSLSFNPEHSKIEKLDLSYNHLRKFNFLSLKSVHSKFPYNQQEEEDNYGENLDEYQDLVENDKDLAYEYDDDERFIIIGKLDLSRNLFRKVNLQHMMQSVSNVNQLDLSRNLIENVNKYLQFLF